MIDSLNIAESVHEGKRRLRTASRWRVLGLALLVLALLGAQGFASVMLRPVSQLYRFDGTNWLEITLPEGESPHQVIPAADGSLWITTRSTCGFLNYQNGTWSDCTGGIASPPFYGNMPLVATHGDQVWVVRDGMVMHYDGTQWLTYDNALPAYSASDIEASDLGVFIGDHYGGLTTFNGSGWTTQSVNTLVNTPNVVGYANSISLAKTTDGTIYMAYNGSIYRYDGSRWQQVGAQTNFSVSQLYAGTDDELWVYENLRGVGTFNLTGRFSFSRKSLGLAAGNPNQLLLINGVPTQTNYLGIYQWQRNRWRILTTLPNDNLYQGFLSADSTGTLWWIGYTQSMYDPYRDARRDIGVFIRYGWWVIALGGLILLSIIRPSVAKRARQTQRTVWAARYDVPDLVTLQVGGGLYRAWIPLFVIVVLITMIILAWGAFRNEEGYKFLAAALVLIWLGLPPVLRWRGYTPARRSMMVEDHVLELSYRLIASLVIGMLLYFPMSELWARLAFSSSIGVLLFPLLALYLGWQTVVLIRRLAVRRATALIQTGDVAAINKQLAWMEERLPMQARCQLLRADLARLRGDLDQAAWWYRQSVYEYQADPRAAAEILIKFADVLERQGRADLVLPLIECAVQIQPESAYGYRALAGFYQRQEIEPARAQSLLQAAAQFGG